MIRKAKTTDAKIIAKYNYLLARETEAVDLDQKKVLAGVKQALTDNRADYYLYQLEGKVVGQVMITREWSDWRNGFFLWIQSVYVHKEYRRQGIFKALYQYVKEIAKKNNEICGLRLYVDKKNKGAQRTYQKMGMAKKEYLLYEWEKK